MTDIPDYLESLFAEALEYYNDNPDITQLEAAGEIAATNEEVTAPNKGSHDVLEVLQDLRDLDALCTDEQKAYEAGATSDDFDEKTIEAIVTRSLEEFLHNQFAEHTATAPNQYV